MSYINFILLELEKYGERDCIICIIGNKLDLEEKRAVDRSRAAQFAKSIGALYYETSAKNNEGRSIINIKIVKYTKNLFRLIIKKHFFGKFSSEM